MTSRPTPISPAPWQPHTPAHGGLMIVDARGFRLASLRYADGSVSTRIGQEEADANRRLMLAAPALLDFAITIGALLYDDDGAPIDGRSGATFIDAVHVALARLTTAAPTIEWEPRRD